MKFLVKPFAHNENRQMILATPLSTATIELKSGILQFYSVSLEFEGEQTPIVDIFYDERVSSPKSLGIGQDIRELSVLWSQLEISLLD